jgi:hypothetical protein
VALKEGCFILSGLRFWESGSFFVCLDGPYAAKGAAIDGST